jgi:hypothetical protein
LQVQHLSTALQVNLNKVNKISVYLIENINLGKNTAEQFIIKFTKFLPLYLDFFLSSVLVVGSSLGIINILLIFLIICAEQRYFIKKNLKIFFWIIL